MRVTLDEVLILAGRSEGCGDPALAEAFLELAGRMERTGVGPGGLDREEPKASAYARGLKRAGRKCGASCGLDELAVVLDPGARMPTRAHDRDAGLDLFPLEEARPWLAAGQTATFSTGVRVAIPPGYEGKVEGRSGMAAQGVAPHGGIIDSGYTDEIKVILTNHSNQSWFGLLGKAIAQLVIYPVALPVPKRVESLAATDRGDAGFGSTDSAQCPPAAAGMGCR